MEDSPRANADWTQIIKSKRSWFQVNLNDLWSYRDLVFLFVKRDFVSQYKQTLLGPFWHIVQPIATTFLFTVVFGIIAKIPTEGPSGLFYLSGLVLWNFFSGNILTTASTFVTNASIFGKVYFPRLVVPIATIISGSIRLAIQFGLFLLFLSYYLIRGTGGVHLTIYAAFLPLLILILSLLSLGFGLLVSSVTTKYRDLSILLGVGLQLMMYLTPVIYPVAIWKNFGWIMKMNPLTPVIEMFRYGMMGVGAPHPEGLLYSIVFSIVVLVAGVLLFNRVEQNFIDTI
jgi:lipopolysaccharide transport system permease protein